MTYNQLGGEASPMKPSGQIENILENVDSS